MRAKIRYSYFSIILTAIVFVAVYAGCFVAIHDTRKFFLLLGIYIILLLLSLWFSPFYLKVDAGYVVMGSIIRSRKLPISEIAGIELFQPTMGAIRVCGSGGFMGYWGLFREGDVGRYQAFYGKASDCFLVSMKNGDKYVLGCENPSAIVDYIRLQMKQLIR